MDSSTNVLFLNFLMSINIFIGPAMGTPNILSLYMRDSIISTATLELIYSDPKVLTSTVFYFLLKKMIRVRLMNINTPLWDLLVTMLLA